LVLNRAIQLEPGSLPAHGNLGWLHLVQGEFQTAQSFLKRASELGQGRVPEYEVALWAMDRTAQGAEERLASSLSAAQQPSPRNAYRAPFALAEARALALAGLGRPQEAVEIMRSAVTIRNGLDLFVRPLYDLLAVPEPVAGLAELLEIWREIIASDPAAAGPWGGPREP
jgi:tetratricopeptide (TPR) repeat protein